MDATFGLQPSKAKSWRLDVSDAALLIIDFQQRLLPAIADFSRVLARAKAITQAAALLEIPIIISEHVPAKLGYTVPELAGPHPCKLVEKNTFSAADVLPSLPSVVLVIGLETHICVRQTVYDLHGAGKRIIVLADACGTRDPVNHTLALEEFRADKISITSTEAMCWECIPRAEGDLFRKMLAILK
ncbi:MAG: isochorismatase family protein [Candidatus Methylacidiphilales bacterium]|nr:isochorismatase family protein [Candidatus Methylacidiphilales bacterium]